MHILRSHHFNAKKKTLFTDRKEQIRFYDLWKQLSQELHTYSVDFLAYELMNEPVADDHEQWNNIVAECVRTIRQLEPGRSLLVGSNRWQGYETMRYLKIPENDPNLIISFHYYNPFLLTHYRAGWTNVKDYTGKVHYPGKLIADEDLKQLKGELYDKFAYWNKVEFNKEVIEKHFKEVVDFARIHQLPLYCGEFGCIAATPKADKERWYQDMIELFDKYGIARANWDYKGGFGIIENGMPQTALIDILTGKNIK